MKPISSVRLRVWLPLFFATSYLLVVLLLSGLEVFEGLDHYEATLRETIRQLSAQSALPLRRALESERPADLQAYIGSLSLRDDLDAILLTDPSHQVIYSNHYAWSGRRLEQVLPESKRLARKVSHQLRLLDTPSGPLSVLPIDYSLPSNGGRSNRQVELWIHLNRERGRQAIVRQAFENTLWVLLWGLLILAGVGWTLYHYLGTPLMRLTAFSHRLAEGDYQARLPVKGRGEVAELANGLHRMAHNVQQAITELRGSEQRLSITLDSIGDAVMVTDTLGLVTRLNAEAARLTGWGQQEALGHPIIEVFRIVNSETREPAEHPVGRVIREGRVVGLANHTTLIARGGQEFQIADSAAPIRDMEGGLLGVIMVFQDISERYRMQSELHDTLERLHALTQALPDPCFVLSQQGEYLEVLGGPDELLARSREQLLGHRLDEILPESSAGPILQTLRETIRSGRPQTLEYSLQLPAGEIHFEGHTSRIMRADGPAVIWQARDITRRKRAEQDILQLANYDPLTGLPNRRQLEQRLAQALARSQRNGVHGALLFIDLDRFKDVNDSLGHLHGDRLLVQITERLRQLIRTEDFAARFGGDEFVILLEDLGQSLAIASEHADTIAGKLRDACARPFKLADQEILVELSIGIVMLPDEGDTEELIKRADIAMYLAKETGRDRACFFSRELQEVAEERIGIQQALRQAIQEDELRLFVQPRVDARGHWLGGEVLVRWQHPERGLLQPNAFIPIAEAGGLIANLDGWVIRHAIQGLAQHTGGLPETFHNLSINLTEPLMMRGGFIQELNEWLSQAALEAERIEFEITERVLLSDYSQAAVIIEQLRDLGIRFSVDDFGTGCSSLRYLQRLPLDALKIDRTFVDRLPGHAGDTAIVETILDMARHLEMDVIAEGVETEAQRGFLATRGCQQFQGYLFAHPMPWEVFFQRLARDGA